MDRGNGHNKSFIKNISEGIYSIIILILAIKTSSNWSDSIAGGIMGACWELFALGVVIFLSWLNNGFIWSKIVFARKKYYLLPKPK